MIDSRSDERAIDLLQDLGRPEPVVDRPVLRLGGGDPDCRLRPRGADGQLVDPERLLVGQEAGAEVGREQELVELHRGEVGRAEDHVGAIDHELAVEPAADDAVRPGLAPRGVQAIELELGLDECHLSSLKSTSLLS